MSGHKGDESTVHQEQDCSQALVRFPVFHSPACGFALEVHVSPKFTVRGRLIFNRLPYSVFMLH